ncbi:hypothetical protein [Halomonas sp.]|uniref:hypothetical protein n=1 Tax=Halomonas sp. TaxID=1486246 RepID=UPI0025BB1FFB|nr:hypothetical protein [Halomonas sp.]
MLAYLWALGVFMSQFYILPSGLPQPAHLLFALNFLLLGYFYSLTIPLSSHDERLTALFLLAFCAYVAISNLAWVLVEQNTTFIKATIYWVYGCLLFLFLLSSLGDDRVRRAVVASCALSIVLLFLFWTTGMGRYEVGSRYQGFFNDPNQMAFYVICVFSTFFYLFRGKGSGHLLFAIAFISVMLVFVTQSRSALLGIFFSLLAAYLRFIDNMAVGSGGRDRILAYIIGIMAVPLFLYLLLSMETADVAVSRFSGTDYGSQAEIRGYTRLQEFPSYLFLGSGQGLDGRFGGRHEIHSTWVAVLFYYGIAGFVIFMAFIARIFLRLDLAGKIAFLGPVFYGLSTYGARTPIFWVFLAAAALAARETRPAPSITPVRELSP